MISGAEASGRLAIELTLCRTAAPNSAKLATPNSTIASCIRREVAAPEVIVSD